MAKHSLLLLLILLLGAGLRFHALGRDTRLHPDEALYSTYARDAALKGDWGLQRPLDKPPLTFYAVAVSMSLVGATTNPAGVLDFPAVQSGEFAARLPNTFASILLVALTCGLAKRLYRDRATSLLAGLLVALSPFALAFSATAFTDVLMTFWMLAALWAASRGRWGWSGVCLALGFASKQPALLYLPLILITGALCAGLSMRVLLRFGALLGLGILLLILWDAARGQPTIWQVSAGRENYPAQLAPPQEIVSRLAIWLGHARWLIGPGGITLSLMLLAVLAGVQALSQKPLREECRIDRALLAYSAGYLLLHWLVAFNTFDRYLLPLVPLAALAAARGLRWLLRLTNRPVLRRTGFALLVLTLLPVAWDASEGRIDIGGDLGQHEGIDLLADYLNSKPVATVIYDRWLGWELDYYLGPWSDKRRVYYPVPALLAAGAAALREKGPRYFPVPVDQPAEEWLAALEQAGFEVRLDYRLRRFRVYALIPPGGAGASAAG